MEYRYDSMSGVDEVMEGLQDMARAALALCKTT